jgi:dimethylhistidine N-methyltransferase
MIEEFKKDVLDGLSKEQKTLPSKYFYDQKGDVLFQQIMAMPEYYLTRSEMEIFSTKSGEIISSFGMKKEQKFELIELGAGDGTKTLKLLKQLQKEAYNVRYIPIDISQNALNGLKSMLEEHLPALEVTPLQGTYFNILEQLKERSEPKVVLFLGSNLGNLLDAEATKFLYQLGASMKTGDKVLLGLDKLKPREIVLPAYNDSQGITREFNLNLLDRINKDLDANFNRTQFDHAPFYEETEGVAKSFIMSKVDQEVEIKSLNKTFSFKNGEKIHTEISRKYSKEILTNILRSTDFQIEHFHTDSKNYFMNVILKKK